MSTKDFREDVRNWIVATVEDDAQEFNALIGRLSQIDKPLAMQLEDAANARTAEATVNAFRLGWETRGNPERVVFED